MLRKVLIAAAATMIVGGAGILSFDEASAQRQGGFSRGSGGGGFSRGSSVRFAGGGMRRHGGRNFGRPSSSRRWPGNHNRVNSTGGSHQRAGSRPSHRRAGSRPSHHRFGSRPSHHRFGSRPSHWRFGSRPSHHRFGSRPSHWRFGSRPSHHRFGSRPHYRKWSWGVGVIPAPVAAPVAAPVSTAPVCYDCGGWTKDGCYMTWRKFVDEEGKAELRCVESCDEEPAAAPPPASRT